MIAKVVTVFFDARGGGESQKGRCRLLLWIPDEQLDGLSLFLLFPPTSEQDADRVDDSPSMYISAPGAVACIRHC